MKNLVIIKHMEDGGKFLFSLPEDRRLHAGDMVVMDTKRGKDQMGFCCCDSFLTEGEEGICEMFGTKPEHLKPITGYLTLVRWEDEESEENEQI